MIRHKDYYNGKFNGEKLLKITSAKLKNRGGRTGITDLIYRSIVKLGACSVSELAQAIWESKESETATSHFKSYQVFNRFVAKTLHKFYANGKITCLRFRTVKGRIYGTSIEECWNYLFKNEIAPERLIKTFMQLIGSQGFVTNIELRELGFDTNSISFWIDKKLAREGSYISVYKISPELRVYYLPRYHGQLQDYLNSEHFREIYEKLSFKRSLAYNAGKVLEDVVKELYKKMGYEYRQHFPIFDYDIKEDKDPKHEEKRLIAILDGLAFKKIEEGNSPNDLIIIECKNCLRPVTFQQIAHLIYIRQIKFKGRGEIHVIALNGATKSIWNNIRFYPFIKVIDWKEFREKCEKYLPETYIRLKNEFGTLSRPVIKHFHNDEEEVEISKVKSYWTTGDKI